MAQGTDDTYEVPLYTKLAFGIGATGESASNWIFNALTFFYYNQILGLSGTLTALAVTVGIFSDALTDPLMGSISDRFRSRYGRRHPFMFAAPLPLVASIYAIYNPPAEFEGIALFLWFMAFTVTMRIASTLFAVPHLALGAELSDDYHQRSRIMSYNNFFTYIGTLSMHCLVWFAVFPLYADGQRDQAAYVPVVAVGISLIVVCILGSAWFTRDQIPRLKQPPSDGGGFLQLFVDMYDAVSNRNYLFLLLGLFLLSMMIGTHETLGIYMGTFYWELSPIQIGWLIMGNVIGYTLGFTYTSRIHEWIDKRWTIVVTAATLSLFWSAAVTLRLFDLAPANGTWTLVVFIVFFGSFASASGSILNISVMSALADVADEHDLKSGRRQEGIFYSARTFFAKATNGVGHIVAGIALDVIEFPTKAVPGEVPADKIFALGIVDGPFAMVWGLLAAFLYAGYRIDRKYHARIRQQLDARDAAARGGA